MKPSILIRSYGYAPIAARGLAAARRYAALAPSAPHALHMPSHIFSMLGMWQEAVRSNLDSDAATLASARNMSPSAIVDQRNSIPIFPARERITQHTAYAAIPVRYAIERGAWKEAATLPPMSTPFRQGEAIVWFGRALGAARSGDTAGAKQDLAQMSRLRQEIASAGDPYWAEQVGIQETAASAWIALAEKQVTRAIPLMRNAADREDRTEKHVAMENRLSPTRELLGELLLEAGKPREALREFERSLRTAPNRFRSLAGAGHSAAQIGNRRLAASYYRQLIALAADADTERPALRAARTFLGENSR